MLACVAGGGMMGWEDEGKEREGGRGRKVEEERGERGTPKRQRERGTPKRQKLKQIYKVKI